MDLQRAGAQRPEDQPSVVLLTRGGCGLCERAARQLADLGDELGFGLTVTDVDAAAAAGDTALRTEFGDRLPVVLLDGAEHSYWEVDEERLRADLDVNSGGQERSDPGMNSGGQERSDPGMNSGGQERSDPGINNR